MIRKFVTVPAIGIVFAAILAGATTVCAQQTTPAHQAPTQQPSSQTPADQSSAGQSSSQEATPEDIGARRKVEAKDYKNWTFNVGGGVCPTNDNTTKLTRSGAVPPG